MASFTRFRKITSLRSIILFPLILALLLLVGVMVLIFQQSQQKVLEQELSVKKKAAENIFLEYRKVDAKMMSLALSTLSLNRELLAAFKARDRERLHDLTGSYSKRLRSQYDVDHFHFIGPDRVNILCLYQPELYGDRNDSVVMKEAEKTGREAQGVELDHLGTFDLSVVTPWFDGERLLGYVELGMDVDYILKQMREDLDSSIYAFIHKDLIQREEWETGIRMHGRNEKWGHFPDSVVIGELPVQIPKDVAQAIAEKHPLQPVTEIHADGRYYRVAFIPILDAAQRKIGHFAILLDTTARISAFHRSVRLLCLFSFLVGAALCLFFYVFLGRVEKEQKRREETRLEFEQRFKIIFDSANDGIMLADAETKKFSLGNKAMCSMLGFGPEEIKTLGVIDIHPEKDLPRVMNQFERMQLREIAVAENLPVKRKDGSVFYADISANPVTLGGKSFHVAIFRDITERKQAEERIRESEARYRSIFEHVDDIIYLLNPDGTFRSLNPAFEKITGWTTKEWIGRPFAPIVHPDDYPYASDIFRKSLAGESSPSFELRLVRKSGEYFEADLCIALGSDGTSCTVGIARDVSKRKRAEAEINKLNEELEARVQERTKQLEDAQEELVRKEKLAILGRISGSIGHELRNPLGVMSNAVYFLKMVLAEADETVGEYLDIIKKEIDNSLRIITDLLDFARTKPPQLKTVHARALIDESLGGCTIPENVELQIAVPSALPPLRVDPAQMGQVLQNLITNGIQAMPAGGTLTIRGELDSEGTVRLEIIDTGEGISPENMKKLFQPLFTTKAKGIGLGLVVCRNLTEANGGRIEVASEPGQGTTFAVVLPIKGGTV